MKAYTDLFNDTKWWMYIPFMTLIKIHRMSEWTFEPNTYYQRANRFLFTILTICFFDVIYGAVILSFFLRK